MKIGLLIYGSLDTLSGGYLYDRKLVEYLRSRGESVEIISLPWRNYISHLGDNLRFRLPGGLDLLIQDELNHPSLLKANSLFHQYPIVSLVHHLRSSELHSRLIRWFYKRVEKQYLSSVDGFIFNSITTKGVVTGLIGEGVPSIIAYPPTDRFGNPISVQDVKKRGEEPGPLKLVFLGNIIPRKGLHTLLQALHRQDFDFRLDIIGSLVADPMYAREMRQMVSDYHLSNKVSFHGHFETQALNERLGQSHVLVVPSSYEGFGIVYLEGMAFGLPAIGTTAGAASEIIRDGQTGYLINPGDSVTLATRLQELSQDRELLTKLSLQALVRYEAQPIWEITAETIRQFLYRMVDIKKI